ncbi:F-box protein [Ananas comosus]|uniref:F-box protein n=1 Tax=Ananas comosus TaxID=4615 RepID=A0A199VJX5_ANACO|nr:F-box protein [Ananas comosus]
MIFLLVPFLSSFLLLLLSKSLSVQSLPSWAADMRLLSSLLLRDLGLQLLCFLQDCTLAGAAAVRIRSPAMPSPRKKLQSRPDGGSGGGESGDPSILDLPELALELVLGKLPPPALCNAAAVCTELRDRCRSDHLWERHVREKWGRVIGGAARREWQLHLASKSAQPKAGGGGGGGGISIGGGGRSKRWIAALSCVWPLSWIRSSADRSCGGNKPKRSGPLPDNSIMAWYMSMETGMFWFPAQVYNREHGHVGFILSCYDAEVSYDCRSDTFHASAISTDRYPPHGRRTIVIEEGVQWDRLRPPPVDTPAHDLHVSDCLNDLRPGDHIEIQWRRNKEFPYGWWYGVVGHLESCDGNEHFCRCHLSDTVALEFNHYTPGSRWRRASVNRKDHREEGNETDGFYGGIRKLHCKAEISKWRQLWPTDILE